MSGKKGKLRRIPAMPSRELSSHLAIYHSMTEAELMGSGPPPPVPPTSTPLTSSSGSSNYRPPRPPSSSSGGTRKYTGLTTSGITTTPQSPMSTPRQKRTPPMVPNSSRKPSGWDRFPVYDATESDKREAARRKREAAARRTSNSAAASSNRSHRRPNAFVDASKTFFAFR